MQRSELVFVELQFVNTLVISFAGPVYRVSAISSVIDDRIDLPAKIDRLIKPERN